MAEIFVVFLVGTLILGAIFGSFINALTFRFNTGRGMGGRSRCMSCRHALGVADLIPVFSYVFLKGRCRYCRAKIALQYPIVELMAAGLSLLIYWSHPNLVEYAVWLAFSLILLFVVVYDIRHGIIPWSAALVLIVLALLHIFLFSEPTLWNFLAGPLLSFPLFFFSLVSRGTWMGWGDGLLELSLGWMLGLSIGGTGLIFAFWIGAVVGIALIILKRGYKMRSELPFAPFLALGALSAHFLHVDFFASLSLLFF